MVDAGDLKSSGRKPVWVRIPPALPDLLSLAFPADSTQTRGVGWRFYSSAGEQSLAENLGSQRINAAKAVGSPRRKQVS